MKEQVDSVLAGLLSAQPARRVTCKNELTNYLKLTCQVKR